MLLNNENIIQVLNKQGIIKLNSHKNVKSIFLFNDSRLKDSYSTSKKNIA